MTGKSRRPPQPWGATRSTVWGDRAPARVRRTAWPSRWGRWLMPNGTGGQCWATTYSGAGFVQQLAALLFTDDQGMGDHGVLLRVGVDGWPPHRRSRLDASILLSDGCRTSIPGCNWWRRAERPPTTQGGERLREGEPVGSGQVVRVGKGDGRRTGGQVEFGEDGAHMALDRRHTDEERRGDLAVGMTGRHQP